VAQGHAVALLLPPGFRCGAILEALAPVDGLRFVLGARLWTPDEVVQEFTEEELDTLEVATESVLIVEPSPRPDRPSPFREDWARTDGGNFTRLEVRMTAISRLDPTRLPIGARIVEVGAGSGLVGLTLLWLRPDLELVALEPRPDRAEMATENARRLGLPTTVRTLTIEETTGRFAAAIVGGGGIEALAATLARLSPTAPVVATFADGHRAHHARELLGNLELVSVAQAVPFGARDAEAASIRLEPAHPVWVAWR
jgi:precorrin-6Y C5,15-methyltransferase (decarboxylating)